MPGPNLVEPGGITPQVPLTSEDMIDLVYSNLDARQVKSTGEVSYDEFWSRDEILAWINEAFTTYLQWMVTSGEGEFETSLTLDLLEGREKYPLPQELLKVSKVERKVGELWTPIRYKRDQFASTGQSTTGVQPADEYTYRFTGGYEIVIAPTPVATESGVLRVWYYYIPAYIRRGRLQSRPAREFLAVWNYMLIVSATISAMQKDRADARPFQERLSKLEAAFRDFLDSRSEDLWTVVPFEVAIGCGGW